MKQLVRNLCRVVTSSNVLLVTGIGGSFPRSPHDAMLFHLPPFSFLRHLFLVKIQRERKRRERKREKRGSREREPKGRRGGGGPYKEVSTVISAFSVSCTYEETAASEKPSTSVPLPLLRAGHHKLIWTAATVAKLASCFQAPSLPSRCQM